MYRKLLLVLLCATFSFAFAQEVPDDSLVLMLEAAKVYYNNGEYESAIMELENALQFLKQFKQSDQVEAYTYLAFSYVAFGDNEKAKGTFQKALTLNPKLELDPAVVSPKIIKVFEEAKAEMATAPPPPPPVIEEPEPPPVKVKKVSTFGAVFRSCVFPGWGQRYKGHSARGSKILIGAGTTLGLSAISITLMEVTHSDYKDVPPGNIEDMNSKYRMYRFWSNAAFFSAISFGVIYLYNVGDAALSGAGETHSSHDNKINPDVAVTHNGLRLGCSLKF